MPSTPSDEVTTLLLEVRRGRREALDELFPLVYDELRRRAHAYLRDERTEHTLSTTALVHEAYLQLVDIDRVEFHDRAHFLAVAATAMRRILVDSARRHRAVKRGGGAGTLSLDNVPAVSVENSEEILVLDGALEKLSRETQRLARIVELRFFGGLTIEETAGALGVAPSTVQLDWQKAKAWLYRELREA
jgi:RNA polymerase sigma factor (TIGR02999 family)